ncbi:MAG: hypothetical protein JWM40_1967 [Frankiales bacterium]|nr:hypothetical protein [Frankiales bacterium]
MSDGVIILLAILGFLIASQAISAIFGHRKWLGPASVASLTASHAGTKAITDQLRQMESTLQDISERVASIEGILQQVE